MRQAFLLDVWGAVEGVRSMTIGELFGLCSAKNLLLSEMLFPNYFDDIQILLQML